MKRVERARDDFEERRERFGKRIREVLADLEPLFERPRQTSPKVQSRGRNEPVTIEAFLTDVLQSVDRYWTATFEAADLPTPSVRYAWIAPESSVLTACGIPADGSVALYCSADDTIYVGQQFAAELYAGALRGLPGETAGFGRAAGDFDVGNAQHHGTPTERRDALLAGFDSGDPSACQRYLPT